MAERIYLDTCSVNRLTDERSQPRVRAEAEAVAHALELVADEQLHWIASSVLRSEILRNPYPLCRVAALEVLSTLETLLFARKLADLGLPAMDAVHLATAEQGEADFLLTTDDRFRRRTLRLAHHLSVQIVNPVDWSQRRQ